MESWLTTDVLANEILYTFNPEDLVNYCGTTTNSLALCKSVGFLRGYLLRSTTPHGSFQRLILATAEKKQNQLCQYLIENAVNLGQEIDDRTIWYAFGYCCEKRNLKLAEFLAPFFDQSRGGAMELYEEYPQMKRNLALLFGATPTEEEQEIIAKVEEDELRPYFFHIAEFFEKEGYALPFEYWCDLLTIEVPVGNIREFVRLSESGVEDVIHGEQADWSIEDEFKWIRPLRNELYASYIRKGNIEEIRTLISIANDRVLIAGLLSGNLPDDLLGEYRDFIGDSGGFTVRKNFKTFYHDRYIKNLNRILATTAQIHFSGLLISIFRFSYFVLSPEEFFEFTERIPYERIPKQERLEYISELVIYAENDGFTTWAKLVQELAEKKLSSASTKKPEEEQ